MDIFPPVTVERFERIQPGDLFVYLSEQNCYAIKTETLSNGDRSSLVVLGPAFPYPANESFLLPWQAANVVSYGKNFSVLLPDDPDAWFDTGTTREPVCLAVSGGKVFVCTNGGSSPREFAQCYVELATGKIVQGRMPGAAYTNQWEIAVSHSRLQPRTLLKYPLRKGATA